MLNCLTLEGCILRKSTLGLGHLTYPDENHGSDRDGDDTRNSWSIKKPVQRLHLMSMVEQGVGYRARSL